MSVLLDILNEGDTFDRVTVVLSSATVRSISDSHGLSVAFELYTPGWGTRQIVVSGDEIIELERNYPARPLKLSELVFNRNSDLESEVRELRRTIQGLNEADMSLEGQVKDLRAKLKQANEDRDVAKSELDAHRREHEQDALDARSRIEVLEAKLKDVTDERDELLAEMAKSADQEDLVEAAAAVGMDADDRLMPEEVFDDVPSDPSLSPGLLCDECSSPICAEGECHGCYARLRAAVGTMVSVSAAANTTHAATWLMAVLLGKQDDEYPETAQIQVDELHEIVKNACHL